MIYDQRIKTLKKAEKNFYATSDFYLITTIGLFATGVSNNFSYDYSLVCCEVLSSFLSFYYTIKGLKYKSIAEFTEHLNWPANGLEKKLQ